MPGAAAASLREKAWLSPADGIAEVYDFSAPFPREVSFRAPWSAGLDSLPLAGVVDGFFDAPHRATRPKHHSLVLLSEGAVDNRVRGSVNGHADSSAVTLGAGAGKGAANVVQGVAKTAQTQTQHPLVHHWWSFIRFAFVIKALCMACNVFYQASPIPLINEFKAKGDTGDADLAPFLAQTYSGWQWCFYGFFAYVVTNKSGFLVLVYSNVVGATLGLYYVYAFNMLCTNPAMHQRKLKYYAVIGCLVAIQAIAIMVLEPVRALFFCGLVSSAWSTLAALALLTTVPIVFEQRSSKSLPFPLLVVGLVSATLWIICGIMLWDPWITFPNVFALTVCTFALYLCWRFPGDGSEDESQFDAEGLAAAKKAISDEATHDFSESPVASPLQRALGFISRDPTEEQTLCETPSAPQYGGTGGTGDGF